MLRAILLTFLQCIILAAGQVSFKLAVEKMPALRWSWSSVVDLLTNWWLLVSGICLISSTLLWAYILKHYPFSVAYPITAFAYIIGMLAAVFIFHESVPPTRWVGVALIIAGVFFIVK